jgi:hypothetical protein
VSNLAETQRREELKWRVLDPPLPLFKEFRQLILRKCIATKKEQITSIFEREPLGEFERFITQKLLDIAKRAVKEELGDEKWIHRVARVSKRSYEERRVSILEFLDTDIFHVSAENCLSVLDPLIKSWDVEFESFGIEIVLNRKLSRNHRKKLEFQEARPEPDLEIEQGLEDFLNDPKLSAGVTPNEIAFLKRLRTNGKRPSLFYYYRELQNLRDPLNFLPVVIEARLGPARLSSKIRRRARRKNARNLGRQEKTQYDFYLSTCYA